MDLGLAGKAAIVSGGSRGIGKAVARQLAREGADVAIFARGKEALDAAAAEIAAETGRRVLAYSVDTGDDQSVRTAIAAAVEALGRVDILVNAAATPGGQQGKPPGLAEVDFQSFWADMNVKVLGYMRTARGVVPHMKQQGWGRIINISGLAARNAGTITGSMRNVSVSAMTKNMADELANTGIGVVCVHPATTVTEATPAVIARNAKAQGVSEAEAEARMAAKNMLGRIVKAEEVADLIVFLASPRAVAVNGDSIAAGGGIRGAIHY